MRGGGRGGGEVRGKARMRHGRAAGRGELLLSLWERFGRQEGRKRVAYLLLRESRHLGLDLSVSFQEAIVEGPELSYVVGEA